MGCGGTGKSFIINTIISIMRNMTQMNDTVKVGAPSGAAAYNVQGSTLHRLLGISVSRPEEKNYRYSTRKPAGMPKTLIVPNH